MGRTSPLQRPSVVENPTVLEPYHAYGHYPLNHEAVPHDKFRRTEVASLNPTQPGVMAYSVPIISQRTSGQEQRTAMSNQPPIQVSGTVIHPSVLSTNPQEVTPSRCEAPASVAYPTPKQEDNSFFFNGNVRHTTRTQSTHPAAEGQTHVHRYSLQPGNELSCMPYPGQQSSYVPGRPSYDSMFLPRPEFPKYSGDPLEYSSFINNFETHVEPRVKDQKMLFCLLTQHCVNSVRERIQHLEGKEQCYQLAKQKLLKEYGSPWIVSDVCEQKLKSFSSIVSGDSKQIKRFAELLEKTYSIMTGISNFGSLDSLDSLTMLVTKLPYELRRRWVDKSVEIQSVTVSLAKFKHLVEFVQRESEIVNSLFGLRNLTTKSDKSRGGKVKVSSYGISTTHNSANSQQEPNPLLKVGVCWFCNRTSHKFTTCEFFLAKSVKERSSFVKKHRLCHKCLSSRHRTPDCKKTRTCSVEGCNGTFHHTLLHYSNETKQRDEPLQEKSTVSTQTGQEKTVGCAVMRPDPHSNSDVYLCAVPVVVSHNGKEVCTYAFLDQGSTHTFCSSDLVNSLQIDGSYSTISLQTINGIKRDCSSTVCELIISDLDNENLFVLPNVFLVDKIPVKPNKIRNKNILDMPHLQDISFKELGGAEVSVLIGADVPEMFCIRSYRKGTHGGPTAIETPLGWSLLGPSLSPSFTTNCKVNFIRKQEDDLHQLVNTLWDADFQPGMGVLDTPNSSEDRNALQRLTTSITTTDDGHYQLPLLWKKDYPSLPNNFEMVKQRLSSLKRRLLKDPSLKAKYTEVVENYVSKGHARRMNFDGGQKQSKISWYLPHHPVINPHKSKIRVVFDCAAKTCNTSSNDKLVRGPDLMNSLIGVLIRFRKELVVLVADVEQMFHQVKVHPEHRDALRFLWWPNGDLDQAPVPYQMTVHIFGAKSSPCCVNFCLRQTAVEFGHLFEPSVSQIVQDSFYVDDCLVSLPTIQEAISAQRGLRELLAKRGFRLRKWITNSEEVLRCIPESKRATISQAHPLDETTNERLLGMLWKLKEDAFTFTADLPKKPLTRRGMLSALSSLFDPLGFVSSVVLEGRLLLQELCKRKADWDEPVTPSEAKRWLQWINFLPSLSGLLIPQCFKSSNLGCVKLVEIHNFSDASSYAYGACSYLRFLSDSGANRSTFVIGKARLAPIKAVTIRRLELTAAVLAVRLNNIIKREMGTEFQCVSKLWTDSTVVLHSVQNKTKRFPPFVANRLAVIERDSDTSQWHYIPSKLNPADIASRGISVDDIGKLQTWLGGPEFLLEPQADPSWEEPQNPIKLPPEFLPTQKKESYACITIDSGNAIDELIERCSSLHKLKVLVAWVLRFKTYVHNRLQKVNFTCSNRLSAEELRNAETALIQYLQHQHFPMFFRDQGSKPHAKSIPRFLKKLHPKVIDGVLRVGGQLNQTPFEFDFKHPIILPQHTHFTNLLIQQHHAEVGHSGASHTWTSLRRRYWIIKGGAAVRKCIGQCVMCKKRNSAVGEQLMADLPPCRLQVDKPPFSCAGVNYLGPLPVKQGRSTVKRYVCVFTCMTMRAVHLEVAHSLDTSSFINALRRFIARRGRPRQVYNDNRTNFVGAEKVLRDALQAFNSNKIHTTCLQQNIEWHFNPPAASHMGGAWERMIRSIRRILRSILGSQSLNDENFLTLMAEIESIINSRPLVPVSFVDSSQEPLTPNHLLLLHENPNLPPGVFSPDDCYSRRRWAQIQYLANQFWRRWQNEFVPNLLQRQKWFEVKKNLQVNDIVLVVQNTQQRSKWVMGRVLETFPDRTGLVRTVLVKMQANVIKRPITKLCPILTSTDL